MALSKYVSLVLRILTPIFAALAIVSLWEVRKGWAILLAGVYIFVRLWELMWTSKVHKPDDL